MDYAHEIKSMVSAKEAFLHYGIELTRSGFCKCFLTGERTASLKVYDGDRGWYCFGCHTHGSVIDFVMQYFGLAFTDAISKINTDFSLGLPIGERISLRQLREMERQQRERQEERDRGQKELERLDGEYWAAFDVWKKYDTNKREYATKSPTEPLHPLFVDALKNIASAEYNLSCAEIARYEYENRNR